MKPDNPLFIFNYEELRVNCKGQRARTETLIRKMVSEDTTQLPAVGMAHRVVARILDGEYTRANESLNKRKLISPWTTNSPQYTDEDREQLRKECFGVEYSRRKKGKRRSH